MIYWLKFFLALVSIYSITKVFSDFGKNKTTHNIGALFGAGIGGLVAYFLIY